MVLLAENLFKECEKDSDILSKDEDIQKSVINRYIKNIDLNLLNKEKIHYY